MNTEHNRGHGSTPIEFPLHWEKEDGSSGTVLLLRSRSDDTFDHLLISADDEDGRSHIVIYEFLGKPITATVGDWAMAEVTDLLLHNLVHLIQFKSKVRKIMAGIDSIESNPLPEQDASE